MRFISSAVQGRPGIDGKRGLPAKDVRNISPILCDTNWITFMPNVSAIFTLLRTKRRVEVENAFFLFTQGENGPKGDIGEKVIKMYC